MLDFKYCPKCGDEIPLTLPRIKCPKCDVPYVAGRPKKKLSKKKAKPKRRGK